MTICGTPSRSLGEFEGQACLCRRTGDPEPHDWQDIQLIMQRENISEQEEDMKWMMLILFIRHLLEFVTNIRRESYFVKQ